MSMVSTDVVVTSSGSIVYPIVVNVWVDFSRVIAMNNLSLGVQIAHEWSSFVRYPELQRKFVACNFSIVRFFVYHVQPCIFWNETTKSGIYDWTNFDKLMQTLQFLGVKDVLICVGHNAEKGLPPGMDRNYNNTGFPNPDSFAAYCRDIASHIKSRGWAVKYWEPYNEPNQIFTDWTRSRMYEEKYEAFVKLFNSAAEAILEFFPDALFGVDISNVKAFLDRFVYDAHHVGFLSFHKYDAYGTWLYAPDGYYSDAKVLEKASILGDSYLYTPREMREKWFSITGHDLPVLCTETNLNSAWRNGTDPRIQQVVGAVWYAEVLRAFILNDVRYSVYFHFASDDSPRWEIDKQTRGYGFGMINSTPPHTEWCPYLLNKLVGNNLHVGDKICWASSSNSTVLSVFTWFSQETGNVLLIGKVRERIKVRINCEGISISNEFIYVSKICEDTRSSDLSIEGFGNSTINENGYFVILLQFKIFAEDQNVK